MFGLYALVAVGTLSSGKTRERGGSVSVSVEGEGRGEEGDSKNFFCQLLLT